MRFKWTKMHAAFIPEIDAEHRNMFRLGEELREAAKAQADGERLHSILDALIACMEGHFSHEERLMHAARYPSFAWHKQQHEAVRKRLHNFAESLGQGDAQAAWMAVEYYGDWLNGHTRLSDRMMAAYLRNHRRLHALAS